jgi:phosphohistidine phosphatase SixA
LSAPPGLILTSGLTRAIETARIIHAAINCRIEAAPALEPGHDASEVVDLISSHSHRKAPLMLVGHNPQLGEVAAILTSGFAGCETMLKTGEGVVIEVNPKDLVGSGRVLARLRLEERCGAGQA